MYTIRKIFKFEAAHILDTCYSEECKNVHGHSYIVEVIIGTKFLNDDGMVIDFKRLKEIVSPLIDAWDHAVISTHSLELFGGKTCKVDFNPTAENMCKYLHDAIVPMLHIVNKDFHLTVRVHETDTGYAEFSEVYYSGNVKSLMEVI
jgi:6-pyruvoyltetrahydropterin/6-carboxytetrahydropterin synthase